MSPVDPPVAERLAEVRRRIEGAGGDPERVTIVAVTKGHPAAVAQEALDAGIADLGESYAQELVAKVEAVSATPGPRWHMVGGLQRNKVKLIAPFVHLWQSIDRLSLAVEVARRAPGASILVQVNVTGLERQGGCRPEQVDAVVDGARDLGLDVRGLMAIGPQGPPEQVRAAFRRVREMADRLDLAERSMGMSGDLEQAVAEGSTMVRVGTALVGPRRGSAAVEQ